MSKTSQSLTAIPLGGLGEFGMNMMALRLGDDIIVIDAGMMFPESELLGNQNYSASIWSSPILLT